MRKIYIAIILLTSAFILNACEKETDVFVPDPGQISGPDTNWYASITSLMPVNELQKSLFLSPDIDSVNLGNVADTIHTASGLQCIFAANSCIDATTGLPIVGKVYMQSYLLKSRGNFIRMGLPTIVNNNLLVSEGMFSIQLQKENAIIQLAKDSVLNISYGDTAIMDHSALFNGNVLQGYNQYSWLQDTSAGNTILSTNDSYSVKTNHLGWVNCGHFYGDTSSNIKTSVSVKLPANLTNANTLAYFIANNIRSIIPMNSIVASRQFIANGVPAGLDVTIVTISKDGNFYYLGKESATTGMPSSQSIDIIPSRVSLDEIKIYLNSL